MSVGTEGNTAPATRLRQILAYLGAVFGLPWASMLSVRNVIRTPTWNPFGPSKRMYRAALKSRLQHVGKRELRRIFEINAMHCTVKGPNRTPLGKIEVAIPCQEEEF
jgi:hypothetical protein